jgi:hypothetical protein
MVLVAALRRSQFHQRLCCLAGTALNGEGAEKRIPINVLHGEEGLYGQD